MNDRKGLGLIQTFFPFPRHLISTLQFAAECQRPILLLWPPQFNQRGPNSVRPQSNPRTLWKTGSCSLRRFSAQPLVREWYNPATAGATLHPYFRLHVVCVSGIFGIR